MDFFYEFRVSSSDNKQTKEIFNNYDQKAITGVKNNDSQYFFSNFKIHFEQNKMIINKFGKRVEFDLGKYPRIYTKGLLQSTKYHKGYHSYYLFFQQDQNFVKIRIHLNNYGKLKDLLNNLDIVDLSNLPEDLKLLSANEKETLLERYRKEKNDKKIFGINNKNEIIHLEKTSPYYLAVLWITFFFILGAGIYLYKYFKKWDIQHLLIIEEIIVLSLILFVIIYEKIKNKIKIHFREDGIITVNSKKFNYKENTVKLKFYRKIQHNPFWHNRDEEFILNDYIIEISDDKGNYIKMELGYSKIDQIRNLVENIIVI